MIMVKDEKAEVLEASGHYRRAADRWLDLFHKGSVKEQEWIVRKRNACLAKARRVKGPGPDHFGNISRAASALQKEMGLDRPGGSAFRISGKK